MSIEYLDLADFIAIAAEVAAWVSLRMFIEINGWTWSARPDIDEAEQFVLSIAAGELDEQGTAFWLHNYLVAPKPP